MQSKVKNELKNNYIIYMDNQYGILYHTPSKKIMKCNVETAKFLKEQIQNDFIEKYVYDYLTSTFGYSNDETSNIELKRIQIMVSSICNLNCIYCYANGGNYGYKEEIMRYEVADKIIEFIKKNISSISEIDFFGGEPIIGYKIIMYICDKLKEENLKLNYTMVSNLTILPEEFILYIKRYNISITVSLDGPKEITDYLRIPKSGSDSTYEKVKNNIERLEKNDIKIKLIECTYGNLHRKTGWTKEKIKIFFERKFEGYSIAICDEFQGEKMEYERVEAEENFIDDKNYELNEKKAIYAWYQGIKGFNICEAGFINITFMTNGDVYPCQIFIKDKKWKIGNIMLNNLPEDLNKSLVIRKIKKEIEMKTECRDCIARISCKQCLGRIIYNSREEVINICDSIRKETQKNILKYFQDK